MKVSAITLVLFFALGSTLAIAQGAGGAGGAGGAAAGTGAGAGGATSGTGTGTAGAGVGGAPVLPATQVAEPPAPTAGARPNGRPVARPTYARQTSNRKG